MTGKLKRGLLILVIAGGAFWVGRDPGILETPLASFQSLWHDGVETMRRWVAGLGESGPEAAPGHWVAPPEDMLGETRATSATLACPEADLLEVEGILMETVRGNSPCVLLEKGTDVRVLSVSENRAEISWGEEPQAGFVHLADLEVFWNLMAEKGAELE
ncbi:MAG: hypothetical protein MJE66_18650 [Proteobacteria bacterium]|nr:hypothetical protein [Pseudomonadota bacterium]